MLLSTAETVWEEKEINKKSFDPLSKQRGEKEVKGTIICERQRRKMWERCLYFNRSKDYLKGFWK